MARPGWLAVLVLTLFGQWCSAQEMLGPPQREEDPPAPNTRAKHDNTLPRTLAVPPSEETPRPVLYPMVAFPPPAPPILDPRTGAWQQARALPGQELILAALPPVAPPYIGSGRPRTLLQKMGDLFCHRARLTPIEPAHLPGGNVVGQTGLPIPQEQEPAPLSPYGRTH